MSLYNVSGGVKLCIQFTSRVHPSSYNQAFSSYALMVSTVVFSSVRYFISRISTLLVLSNRVGSGVFEYEVFPAETLLEVRCATETI